MAFPRGALFTILLSAAALGGMLYLASPVEARSNPTVSPATPRVFSNLPLPDREEFLLQAAAQKPAQPDIPLPEGKGKDLTQKNCSTCHANNVWTGQHHTRDQWNQVIDNMVSKGMKASDDDLDVIADYLAANFGPAAKTPPTSAPPP
jgi:hypothetical protein